MASSSSKFLPFFVWRHQANSDLPLFAIFVALLGAEEDFNDRITKANLNALCGPRRWCTDTHTDQAPSTKDSESKQCTLRPEGAKGSNCDSN